MSFRVLVVDDDPALRALLGATLAGRGYEVVEAADGVAGVAAARGLRPAVVVSDVQMPRLDGFGLCQALKRDPATAGIPVLLISGATADLAGRARAAGARDAMGKPFSPLRLAERVARLAAAAGEPTTE